MKRFIAVLVGNIAAVAGSMVPGPAHAQDGMKTYRVSAFCWVSYLSNRSGETSQGYVVTPVFEYDSAQPASNADETNFPPGDGGNIVWMGEGYPGLNPDIFLAYLRKTVVPSQADELSGVVCKGWLKKDVANERQLAFVEFVRVNKRELRQSDWAPGK